VATVLAWVPLSSALCLGACCFIKHLFPLDQHIRGICPRSASDPFVEEGLARCGWWRPCVARVTPVSSCRSCRDPGTFNKASVQGFHRLRRLWPLVVKMSAGCWRSRILGRNRPPGPDIVVIPGTSAGGWLRPWPTQIVIPMTLAPETGEVSWDSMGLWWVLFLAEVDSYSSESHDLSSGWKAVDLEVKSCRVRQAVSGCASSRTELAGSCSAAITRLLGTCASQSFDPRCHRPVCRSVTSRRLQSCRLLRQP
jgi:hypothetical protein